jgi:hypothetical protein
MTYSEYSSCSIHPTNSLKSKLRILVHDLKEGERREYGCGAHAASGKGDPIFKNWKIVVKRISKFVLKVILFVSLFLL